LKTLNEVADFVILRNIWKQVLFREEKLGCFEVEALNFKG
jgi:hypothetical protein